MILQRDSGGDSTSGGRNAAQWLRSGNGSAQHRRSLVVGELSSIRG